jgi:hypothetical protein
MIFSLIKKKKKKYRPLYGISRNISGAIMIETGFVLPLIFFLFASIFWLSVQYMTARSIDLIAADIARRFLYTKATVTKNVSNIPRIQSQVCKKSFVFVKCSNVRIYIDAYERNEFLKINTAGGGLKSVLDSAGNPKGSWIQKDNAAPANSADYFKDNAENLFIVRVAYPGTKYVGISMTQGQ